MAPARTPYLTLGTDTIDPLHLQAPGRRYMTSDERGIPTGSEPVEGTEFDFLTARELGDTQLDTGYDDLRRDEDGRARVRLSTAGRTQAGHAVARRGLPVPHAVHRRFAARARPPPARPGDRADDLRAECAAVRRRTADPGARRVVRQPPGASPPSSERSCPILSESSQSSR